MEFEQGDYLTDTEEDCVKGTTVLGIDDGGYHLAEKWLREEKDDIWIQYHVSEAEMEKRVESGSIVRKGSLTDEQFAQVAELVGHAQREVTV